MLPYAWPNPVDETASVQAPSQHKTFVLGGWGSSAGRAQAHATFSSRWSHALYLVRDEVVSSWKLAGTRAGNRPMHMYRLETSAHQRRPKHHTSRKQHIWLPHEPRTATRLPGCCTCIKTGHHARMTPQHTPPRHQHTRKAPLLLRAKQEPPLTMRYSYRYIQWPVLAFWCRAFKRAVALSTRPSTWRLSLCNTIRRPSKTNSGQPAPCPSTHRRKR